MVVKVKAVAQYKGHSVGQNGNLDLKMGFDYSELVNVIGLQQMLSNDINIKVKFPGEKAFPLGVFRLKNTRIDGDGTTNVTFNSLSDYVEVDNLNKMVGSRDERFQVLFMAEVELDDNDDDGGDDDGE